MKNNCSISIILRTDKRNARTGLCPIALQAFINSVRRAISLNLFVKQEDWDSNKRRINGNHPENKSMNLVIEKQLSKANQIIIDYHLLDKELTPDLFVDEYTERASRNDFVAFYQSELDRRYKSEVIGNGTYKGQKSTLTKIKLFKKEIKFSELTPDFIEKFDSWHRKYLKKSCSDLGKEQVMDSLNTRAKAKAHIRTYIKLAIKRRGIRIQDPFDVVKVKNIQTERTFLEKDELQRLDNLFINDTLSSYMQATLAKFMFACMTSLRVGDTLRLYEIKVIDSALVFVPEKGRRKGKRITIPMNKNALRYYEYLRSIDFNIVSDIKMNAGLKKIAKHAQINKHLTFHVARHTFATQFIAQGGEVTVLKDIMSHEDIRTTMIYVHMAKDVKREQIMLMDELFVKEEGSNNV